jgi:hypothetical protein
MTTPLAPLLLDPAAFSLPDPPAELAPDAYAGRLYDMLEPLAQADPQVGWSLLILCNAVGLAYELVEDLVRDTPDGPGWSAIMDVDRCPPAALPWLGQFAGVRIPPALSSVNDQRAWVASTDGFNRGTVAALRNAARHTLTGNASVFMTERNGNPADKPDYAYYLTVVTYRGQTPDPGMTERALLAQKPGGLILTYVCVDGQVYDQVRTRFATYADLEAGYPNYQAVWTDTPP